MGEVNCGICEIDLLQNGSSAYHDTMIISACVCLPVSTTTAWCEGRTWAKIPYPLGHRYAETTKKNMWQKDLWPVHEDNKTQIITSLDYSAQKLYFYVDPDYNTFATGPVRTTANLLTTESYSYRQNSYVVYKGRIIWVDQHQLQLVDWQSNPRSSKEKKISLADLPIKKMSYYQQSSLYNYVDIVADEYGIYLLYADSERDDKISITKLDPETLTPNRTWHSNALKKTTCTAFMACGKLFTFNNCQRYTANFCLLNSRGRIMEFLFEFIIYTCHNHATFMLLLGPSHRGLRRHNSKIT